MKLSSSHQSIFAVDNIQPMSLVQGYSSDSDFEGIPSPQGTFAVTTSGNTPTKNNDQTTTSFPSSSIKKQQIDESAFILSTNANKKRHYFKKSELKAKKQKRDGKGPWGSWSSSSDEEVSASNISSAFEFKEDSVDDLDPELSEKETSKFYGKSLVDYQGRGFLQPPIEEDIDFHKASLSFQCFLPKKIIYTFKGHVNGTTKLKFLPETGHLFLSGGNDNIINIWDMYHERTLLRDYRGHRKAVRDINFNSDGTEFLSVSFDQTLKVWDTETGKVKSRLKWHSVPNCATYHPTNNNEYIVGLSNSEIRHYDSRVSNKEGLIQTYNHHLSSIISLKYFPDGSKFISSSEDKTVRIWENQVNIPIKQISDTSQYSMPYLDIHPEQHYFSAQSMDNAIYSFSMKPKYKKNLKKVFRGHLCAGFGINFGFSPDGQYVVSGDSRGSVVVWDWKTTRTLKRFEVPDGKPVTTLAWHPQETSKMLCSGNGGKIYLFD